MTAPEPGRAAEEAAERLRTGEGPRGRGPHCSRQPVLFPRPALLLRVPCLLRPPPSPTQLRRSAELGSRQSDLTASQPSSPLVECSGSQDLSRRASCNVLTLPGLTLASRLHFPTCKMGVTVAAPQRVRALVNDTVAHLAQCSAHRGCPPAEAVATLIVGTCVGPARRQGDGPDGSPGSTRSSAGAGTPCW